MRGRQGCDSRTAQALLLGQAQNPDSSGPAPVHGPAQLLQFSSSGLEIRVQGQTLLRRKQVGVCCHPPISPLLQHHCQDLLAGFGFLALES